MAWLWLAALTWGPALSSPPTPSSTDTMWVQVRTMDGKETHTIDSLSRLTKVEELRRKIFFLKKYIN
jgi:hypothetical protein